MDMLHVDAAKIMLTFNKMVMKTVPPKQWMTGGKQK